MLLCTASQDVAIRYFGTDEDRADLVRNGIDWDPKLDLRPGIKLTRGLSARISAALAALEELGCVRRIGKPTRYVKVTRKGLVEAGNLARRHGQPPSTVREEAAFIRRSLDEQAESGDHLRWIDGQLRHVEENPFGPSETWRAHLRWARKRLKEHPEDEQLRVRVERLEYGVRHNRVYEAAMNDLRIARFAAVLEMHIEGATTWGAEPADPKVYRGMAFYLRKHTFRYAVIPTFPVIPNYPMPPGFEKGLPGPDDPGSALLDPESDGETIREAVAKGEFYMQLQPLP